MSEPTAEPSAAAMEKARELWKMRSWSDTDAAIFRVALALDAFARDFAAQAVKEDRTHCTISCARSREVLRG